VVRQLAAFRSQIPARQRLLLVFRFRRSRNRFLLAGLYTLDNEGASIAGRLVRAGCMPKHPFSNGANWTTDQEDHHGSGAEGTGIVDAHSPSS